MFLPGLSLPDGNPASGLPTEGETTKTATPGDGAFARILGSGRPADSGDVDERKIEGALAKFSVPKAASSDLQPDFLGPEAVVSLIPELKPDETTDPLMGAVLVPGSFVAEEVAATPPAPAADKLPKDAERAINVDPSQASAEAPKGRDAPATAELTTPLAGKSEQVTLRANPEAATRALDDPALRSRTEPVTVGEGDGTAPKEARTTVPNRLDALEAPLRTGAERSTDRRADGQGGAKSEPLVRSRDTGDSVPPPAAKPVPAKPVEGDPSTRQSLATLATDTPKTEAPAGPSRDPAGIARLSSEPTIPAASPDRPESAGKVPEIGSGSPVIKADASRSETGTLLPQSFQKEPPKTADDTGRSAPSPTAIPAQAAPAIGQAAPAASVIAKQTLANRVGAAKDDAEEVRRVSEVENPRSMRAEATTAAPSKTTAAAPPVPTVVEAMNVAPTAPSSTETVTPDLSPDAMFDGVSSESRTVDAMGRTETSAQATRSAELPRPAMNQIIDALRTAQGSIDLSLSPEELGRVNLTLQTQDGILSVVVTAERPETADLIRRSLDLLLQEAEAQGFDDVSFAFGGDGTQGQGYSDDGADHPGQTMAGAAFETLEPTKPIQRQTTAQGLDLRL